jgi:hypothetical protein
MNIAQRIAIEKRVIRKLIRVAKAHGYKLTKIWDGEQMERVSTETEAMALVFNLDECRMYFKRDDQPKAHCAVIILGNDGWDSIADCSMGEGWDDVMEAMNDYSDKLCDECLSA